MQREESQQSPSRGSKPHVLLSHTVRGFEKSVHTSLFSSILVVLPRTSRLISLSAANWFVYPKNMPARFTIPRLPAGFSASYLLYILFLILFHDNNLLTFLLVQVNKLHIKQLTKNLWVSPWYCLIGLLKKDWWTSKKTEI